MSALHEWFATRYPEAYTHHALYRFSHEVSGYASNGISALRVEGVECGGKPIPGCYTLFRRPVVGSTVSLSALREWAGEDMYTMGDVAEDCADCEGCGRDDCPHCDQEMDCETCDGSGKSGNTNFGAGTYASSAIDATTAFGVTTPTANV
jgi:hypothetical protein